MREQAAQHVPSLIRFPVFLFRTFWLWFAIVYNIPAAVCPGHENRLPQKSTPSKNITVNFTVTRLALIVASVSLV